MSKSLVSIPTSFVGVASANTRPVAGLTDGATRFRAIWENPEGILVQATAPFEGGSWSAPTVALRDFSMAGGPLWPDRPDGVLAWITYGPDKIALRTGGRRPGVRPQFPSAELIVSREVNGCWRDLGYATEPLDKNIVAAAICAVGDKMSAVYLVTGNCGVVFCRALRFSLTTTPPADGVWQRLPDYPLTPGVAGVMAGVHGNHVIAAGGANFPERPPWEGGTKKTYDEIFVLPRGAREWIPAGRLPESRAYAAAVAVPGGLLIIGGENATKVHQDCYLLHWNGKEAVALPAPRLPVPLSSPVAALLDGKVYLAGGYHSGPPRSSTGYFLCLDLANTEAGWQLLPSWPGPTRAQGVIAVVDEAIYLISGLELKAGSEGKSQSTYLIDAYRYQPGRLWERLPDLPWSVLAAPTPAPVTTNPARVFLLGGVDGRQAGLLPRDTRVPEDILCFDVARNEWLLWHEPWPEPVVTAPAVEVEGRWIFVSGETMAGKRTTVVQSWQPST